MNALGAIAERYGQTVTLRRAAGERTVRAFIRPAPERQEAVPEEQTAIGWTDRRLWRYIGTEEVQPGDGVVWNGTAYRVRSSRAYALGDAVHHWQAFLEPEREAAT